MTEDKIKAEFRQHGEHTWWCNWTYFWWAEHGMLSDNYWFCGCKCHKHKDKQDKTE